MTSGEAGPDIRSVVQNIMFKEHLTVKTKLMEPVCLFKEFYDFWGFIGLLFKI